MCESKWGYCPNGHRVGIFKMSDRTTWKGCGWRAVFHDVNEYVPENWAKKPSQFPKGMICPSCPDGEALRKDRRHKRTHGDIEARAQNSADTFSDINWNSGKTVSGQVRTPVSGISPMGTAASSVAGDGGGGSGYQSGHYSGGGGGGDDQGYAQYYGNEYEYDDIYSVSHQGSRQGSQGGSGDNTRKSSRSGKNSQSGSRG